MNAITPFQFGAAEVRTLTNAGEPWFVAADVCRVLEIANVSDAVASLDEDERAAQAGIVTADVSPSGATQSRTLLIISESGLYSLVLRSRKPEAKAFKRWVTHEVLPAIRKTGSYSLAPKTYVEALRELASEIEQRERLQIECETMKPKADFFDAVTASADSLGMNEVAKLLGRGRNTLMEQLRAMKILRTGGRAHNTPYQEFLDRGYFEVTEGKYTDSKAVAHITLATRVFQRGVDFLRKKLAEPAA